MATVVRSEGPNYKGTYKAYLDDGTEITYGEIDDPKKPYYRPNDHRWWVSVGDRYNHTTFIVEPSRDMIGNEGMWMVHQIKSRGADKDFWRLYSIMTLPGLYDD